MLYLGDYIKVMYICKSENANTFYKNCQHIILINLLILRAITTITVFYPLTINNVSSETIIQINGRCKHIFSRGTFKMSPQIT